MDPIEGNVFLWYMYNSLRKCMKFPFSDHGSDHFQLVLGNLHVIMDREVFLRFYCPRTLGCEGREAISLHALQSNASHRHTVRDKETKQIINMKPIVRISSSGRISAR